jgi:predicted RNA-binding protein with PIN domain
MSNARLLLVDGYNVIHRLPELEPSLAGGLQNARNQLALRVAAWGREHPGVECVIVFDGEYERSGGRGGERIAGVRCVYSLEAHGADAEIVRRVREFGGRQSDVIVVSDDNYVGNNCRAHGADVRPSGFLAAGKGRPRTAAADRGKAAGPAASRRIGRRAAREIDDELRKKFGIS